MVSSQLVEMEKYAQEVKCNGAQGKIAHSLRVLGTMAPHFVIDSVSRLIPRFLRLNPMINDTNLRSYGEDMSLADITRQLPQDIAAVTKAVNECKERCGDYTQCKIHKVIAR